MERYWYSYFQKETWATSAWGTVTHRLHRYMEHTSAVILVTWNHDPYCKIYNTSTAYRSGFIWKALTVTSLGSAKWDRLVSGKEVTLHFLDNILYLHWSCAGGGAGSTEKACTVTEIWVLSSDALKQWQDTERIQKETSRGPWRLHCFIRNLDLVVETQSTLQCCMFKAVTRNLRKSCLYYKQNIWSTRWSRWNSSSLRTMSLFLIVNCTTLVLFPVSVGIEMC